MTNYVVMFVLTWMTYYSHIACHRIYLCLSYCIIVESIRRVPSASSVVVFVLLSPGMAMLPIMGLSPSLPWTMVYASVLTIEKIL